MPQKTQSKNMKFTKDEFGKDVLLKDDSLQVMMEWEKPYMEACIEALKPHGDVLEIGFGLGYSATAIEKFKPKSHTIIECDPVVFKKAEEWAKKYPNVKLIQGTWQQTLAKLGNFDSIFFDDYSPLSEKEIEKLIENSEVCEKLNEETQEILQNLEKTIKTFKNIHFSDEDLKHFANKVLSQYPVTPEYVMKFINNLENWGNITAQQKQAFIREFEVTIKNRKAQKPTQMQQTKLPGDRFISFTEACLEHHMRKGSKLSAYMGSPESKGHHPEFQKRILSRKDVQYSEKTISIEVPPNCNYYRDNKALVIVIEKK